MVVTAETRMKISASLTGRTLSAEHRAHISHSALGRPGTFERDNPPTGWLDKSVAGTRAYHLARHDERERSRAYIRAQQENVPCLDCGYSFPVESMDFDHVPERGPKAFGLGGFSVLNHSLDEIKAEVAKCDVVCANCHRVRTVKRMHKAL